MSITFEILDEEDLRIHIIMNKYYIRKRENMQPSPYALFFLDKGEEILKTMKRETGNTPTPDNGIKRISFEWRRLSEYEKNIYIRASYKLSYDPKAINTKELIKKIHGKSRINQLREFFKLFAF